MRACVVALCLLFSFLFCRVQVSQDATVKKERILILTDLLASAGSLVRPYVSSIMPRLLSELQVTVERGAKEVGGGGG